tara:strand:+ start:474 stop:599 length:126 start_codon:yes stop_codon:yes gene_type:complete
VYEIGEIIINPIEKNLIIKIKSLNKKVSKAVSFKIPKQKIK